MYLSKIGSVIGFGAIAGGGYLLGSWIFEDPPNAWGPTTSQANPLNVKASRRPIPSREFQLKSLAGENFDVLVIGGGATGSGTALDAVTRGLKTALVEQDDFSSGTSSRSTKLIHGGVRYLQKAIMRLDVEQFRMVKEALHERANLLEIAPHLSYPLPIMLPIYKWWQVPYFWFGIKMYDLVAGTKCLKSSYYLSKKDALSFFPMLRRDRLCGALVYYDGAHNDARMNLAIAITATRMGATIANHVKVMELLKERDLDGIQHIVGAKCKDELTGKEFSVRAKCIINATGPFIDSIRKMDDPNIKEMCAPSAGVHIVLPGYYSPENMGLLDPSTSDGRVIFFLPWLKNTIAGTTDKSCPITTSPAPSEKDIQFILNEIRNYLSPDLEVRRGDVLSAWSGIRPLVLDLKKENTESLARNHVVNVSETGLITIGGGKWTTYRAMAKDAMDIAVQEYNFKSAGPSQTDGLLLEGAHGYSATVFIRLVQDIGLEPEVAKNLAASYGDRAFSVAKMATLTGKRFPVVGKRIHPEFPYIEAEVKYAMKEYACTVVDVIARRLRLAFLNVEAAEESIPKIIEIMGDELKWSTSQRQQQYDEAMEFLNVQMGKNVNVETKGLLDYVLSPEEKEIYTKRFQTLDLDKKGFISIVDLRKGLARQGESISGEILHDILKELDTNRNGQVELEEYLALMCAIKSGKISNSRFERMLEMEEERLRTAWRSPTVERSGGGI